MVCLCTTLWFFALCDRKYICFGWKESVKVESGTYYYMVGDAYVYATF
jgi:hypothetical protein